MNEVIKKENPFTSPIVAMCHKISSISWRMPFIPQVIQFLVQLFVLFILCALFCTIGMVFNLYSIFCNLLAGTREEFNGSDLVGKSAYALMAGIYLILAAPCWVIVAPFMLLGWCWDRMSWFGLLLYSAIIGLLIIVVVQRSYIYEWWQNRASSAILGNYSD